ncbi:MAG: septum formation initiator family protein, partial [candidate division NC10 bacterium]|nr:septum formation initiator family protein [candidate division NC10 bacterium]
MEPLGLEEEEQEEQAIRRRKRYRLLAFILLLLAVLSLWGNRNLVHLYQLHKTKTELQAEIHRLREAVEALNEEARAFKTQPGRVEEIAREDLGLVKPGEVVYQLSPA